MHFILLVYKYEYIMNKSSYFVDLVEVVWYFPQNNPTPDLQIFLKCDVYVDFLCYIDWKWHASLRS